MIYIYHGDNTLLSRQNLNLYLDQQTAANIIRIDTKETDYNQLNLILNSTSFLPSNKIIVFTNFFSIQKTVFDKIVKLISKTDSDIIIWQEKKLTVSQLNIFPKAKIFLFKNESYLFSCLYAIKPHNFSKFYQYYQQIVAHEEIDLFMYLLRQHFRKIILANPKNKDTRLAYIQLIELDYLQKTGRLTTPKNIALSRIIFNLMN